MATGWFLVIATVLIGTWTKEFDAGRARQVLRGDLPFDEETMVGDHDGVSPHQNSLGSDKPESVTAAGAAPAKDQREATLTR